MIVLICAAAAHAFRPYARSNEAKTSWMSVYALKTGQDYYMEVSADGSVLTRAETKGSIITRRGKIRAQLAKDFFREIESSDIITAQGGRESKLVFYKGETLKISAYVSGELRRINAPLDNFGEAFSYAFNEVKKAAEQLAAEKQIKGFLLAEPIEGMDLERYQANASKAGGSRAIETYDIQKAPTLLKAIKQPHRLIPLESDAEMKDIQNFISTHGLYGLMKLFYLPSTRGTFKCQVLDASKKR